MPAAVICLSHTEGAGGPGIGRGVADALGLRYADESIILDAARARGLYPEAVALAEARDAGRRLEVDFGRSEPTEELRGLIRDAVVAAADEGGVVIVSHAAAYPLAGRPGVLRVLVTGSTDVRARRVGEAQGLDPKAARRAVRESDRGRAAYIKRFYGVARELPVHYDLVLSTDALTADRAVRTIIAAARPAG